MKVCRRCGSTRVTWISAKCSDCFMCRVADHDMYEGYVPVDMGISDGSGDYVEFDYCLDCGQIQSEFPVLATEVLDDENDEDEEEEE